MYDVKNDCCEEMRELKAQQKLGDFVISMGDEASFL
jgi:hypothetical protein